MSNYDFKEKVVLITGAGKGAGRALAEHFAARGAIVAANDISPINIEEIVAQIKARGGNAKAYIDDIAKKVAVQALINNVEDDFGRIDLLINHAAVEPHASLLNMDEWDWHRTLDVNLTGAFLMIQSVGRVMREQGRGMIINIVTGTNRDVGKEAGAYFASMAGLAELSHRADRELSQFGVRVVAIENREGKKIVEAVMSVFNQEVQ